MGNHPLLSLPTQIITLTAPKRASITLIPPQIFFCVWRSVSRFIWAQFCGPLTACILKSFMS